ncbi:hypothetical protein ACFCP7_22445 [Paenibacillus elgii]
MLFFTPTMVNVLGFKINAVDNASVVNAGPVQSIDEFLSYKRNQSVGEMNGDLSPLTLPIGNIVDPDIVDGAAAKGSAI